MLDYGARDCEFVRVMARDVGGGGGSRSGDEGLEDRVL